MELVVITSRKLGLGFRIDQVTFIVSWGIIADAKAEAEAEAALWQGKLLGSFRLLRFLGSM